MYVDGLCADLLQAKNKKINKKQETCARRLEIDSVSGKSGLSLFFNVLLISRYYTEAGLA